MNNNPAVSWENGGAFILENERATHDVAQQLAHRLGRGDCIALYGDIGAGKTVFCRALIQALTEENTEVASPTFTIVQEYSYKKKANEAVPIWHLDLYRIEVESELAELGLEEMIETGITLIEWPEVARAYLPKSTLELHMRLKNTDTYEVNMPRMLEVTIPYK